MLKKLLAWLLLWTLLYFAPDWADWLQRPASGAFPDDSDGPYPVRWITADEDPAYAETDSTRWLALIKDDNANRLLEYTDGEASVWVREHGGIEYNNLKTGNLETLRRFRIYTDRDFYFDDIVFARTLLENGTYKWIAKLSNANVVGEILRSDGYGFSLRRWGVARTHLRMYKSWDAMPIWNGYANAIVFGSADGDSMNVNWANTAASYGVGYTAFIVPGTIGGAATLSWAEVRTMLGQGVEIAAHAANDGVTFADAGGYGWVRCFPSGTSVSQLDGYPASAAEDNLDDIGMHDGMASFEAWYDGMSTPRYETFSLGNMPAALDTLRYGTIDSVVVWAAWRVAASVDTAATGTRQVAFSKSSPNTATSPGFNTSTVTLSGRSREWQMVRTKLTTDGSGTPLYWTNVRSWAIGPRVVASDTTLYCTQFFMDIHAGGVDAPRFDQWGLPVHFQDFQEADTLLAYEIIDAKKILEDQLKPTNIGYTCRGVSCVANLITPKAQALMAPFYDYARSGFRRDEPWEGLRDSDRRYPSWWDLQRYDIVAIPSASNLFGSGASFTTAQVDSAVQYYLDYYHDRADVSINGGSYVRKNILMVVGAHNSAECTAAQLGQFIQTVQADGRYWITTLGDAVDYWTKAQDRTRYKQPR